MGIKTDNIRIVVNRVDDFFTADDLRHSARRKPDMYVFDEEAGELLLTTCVAMSDKGQAHLIEKGQTISLEMGEKDPCYIGLDVLDDAIALLQVARQKITDSPALSSI